MDPRCQDRNEIGGWSIEGDRLPSSLNHNTRINLSSSSSSSSSSPSIYFCFNLSNCTKSRKPFVPFSEYLSQISSESCKSLYDNFILVENRSYRLPWLGFFSNFRHSSVISLASGKTCTIVSLSYVAWWYLHAPRIVPALIVETIQRRTLQRRCVVSYC